MPELPEVETVRKVLKNWLTNQEVKQCYVIYSPIIENSDEVKLNQTLKGQKIIDVKRRGKFLIIVLERNVLISHLRMEGKYHYGLFAKKPSIIEDHSYYWNDQELYPENKHVHFVIRFTDDRILMYDDVRKFGRIQLSTLEECFLIPPLSNVGIEANNQDLTPSYLLEKFKSLKTTIKQALLNQKIISGLGNIYVDEVLFYAKINPTKKACAISLDEAKLIIEGSGKVLEKAILLGGSTIRSYTSSNGVDGHFQNELMVYGKDGSSCLLCNSTIVKIKVGGRGTHYCPTCQKG